MQGVIAAAELDATVHAIEDLRKQNFRDILCLQARCPCHEPRARDRCPESKVRRSRPSAACAASPPSGYWILSDLRPRPPVVGAKAVASWIPYTIIGFELMVLIGSL
jgi:hypothetical protein